MASTPSTNPRGLRHKDDMVTTVDADGVALAAIQGLSELVKEKDAKIADMEKRLEKLENLLSTPAKETHHGRQ